MAQTITLKAEARSTKGKGAARQLRAQGKVPAVVYGHGRTPESLILSASDLEKALTGVSAESTLVDLKIGRQRVKTLIREVQRHPTRSEITHVDFLEIHADEKIRLSVPIHLEGSPDGVRNAGGVLDQVLREIEIEVLPRDIPERFTLDVTELGVAKSLHVRDIALGDLTVLTDRDATVCTVIPPRVEEEVAEPAEVAPEEAEEPELIRKPKAEEEGEASDEV